MQACKDEQKAGEEVRNRVEGAERFAEERRKRFERSGAAGVKVDAACRMEERRGKLRGVVV